MAKFQKATSCAMDEGPGEWTVTNVLNTQLLSIAFRSELIRCAV